MAFSWEKRLRPKIPADKRSIFLGQGSLVIVDEHNANGKYYIIRSHSNPHVVWPILDMAMDALERRSGSISLPTADEFVETANILHEGNVVTAYERQYRYKEKMPKWITPSSIRYQSGFFGSKFDEYLYTVDLITGKIRWIR